MPALLLLALDCFKECTEIAFSEAKRISATLNDFKEKRGTVEDALREKLKQIAVLAIPIGEDLQSLQVFDVFLNHAHAFDELRVVVGIGHIQELLSQPSHLVNRVDDVGREQSDVLNTWSIVLVEVLLNLRVLR